jgi:HD-GYP domain-containing protein (c-di-GMP phosphodiesterase class II)
MQPPANELALDRMLVDGLIELVRQRDELLAEHLEAVGLLSARLARALKYGPDAVARVAIAARLHDIGMQSIDRPAGEVLGEADWRKIKRHPDLSASAVAAFPSLSKYRSIVRSHHERVDGRGYPDGLLGAEIPYQSRIIAIADAFHAMTAVNGYRAIRIPTDAVDEIVACGGTQFDADFATVFAETMNPGARASRTGRMSGSG